MSGAGMSLGAAHLISNLARLVELLVQHTPADQQDLPEVLDARAVLEKHAEGIAEARRLDARAAAAISPAPFAESVDATPSMAWTCPTCQARPFEPCSRDGKFSKELHDDRLPPGAKR